MKSILYSILVLAVFCGSASISHGLPPGFASEEMGGVWDQAVGLTFDTNGRAFVWEKGGRVWLIENGEKSPSPVIDLSEEVGNWQSHGLLGFALDPQFMTNGYIYLYYTVDYHHLMHFGTPEYDAQADEYNYDTIARIVRYTCGAEDGFRSVVPGSRLVLVGATPSTGIPICHLSHGVGSLVFAEDGTLLAAAGDSASFLGLDDGGETAGSSNTALADGIIRAAEDVGAFRAQLVNSHCGKILRIDPTTGAGLPGNPFFDAAAPRAPASRTWALGLRNPFRFTLRPGTGATDPAAGDPGTLYIGDVGWNTFEEIVVMKAGGLNAGWPVYEGMWGQPVYGAKRVANLDSPNPLFDGGQGPCDQPYFYFNDLILAGSILNPPDFLNPCDPAQFIPEDIPHFVHQRPRVDWAHGTSQVRVLVNTGIYESVQRLGESGSQAVGDPFPGTSSTGGVWYTGDSFPESYRDTYFHGDYSGKWIRNFVFDGNDQLQEVRDFLPDGSASVVAMAVHPLDGSLWYVDFRGDGSSKVMRVRWTDNLPPVAVATANPTYGPAPLTVAFDGGASHDPESQEVSYSWDFGDGTPASQLAAPLHVFPSEDITESGVAIAKVYSMDPPGPQGEGNPNIAVMSDDSWPARGSADPLTQFDTFHRGTQGDEDWIGYTFSEIRRLHGVFFQEGMHFSTGGWYDEIGVQVRQGGEWADVADLTVSPAYTGSNAESFGLFEIKFHPIAADGLRLYGNPGGTANFISVAELRVIAESAVLPVGPLRHDIVLEVSDELGGTSSTGMLVAVNNTPPDIDILSPVDGSTYAIDSETVLPLVADICDAEHDESELTCRWQTILHHNNHTHPEPFDTDCATSTILQPIGCDGESYFFEIVLTVTDAHGLSAVDSVRLFPDCTPLPGDQNQDFDVDLADAAALVRCFGLLPLRHDACEHTDLNQDGRVDLVDYAILAGVLTGPRLVHPQLQPPQRREPRCPSTPKGARETR